MQNINVTSNGCINAPLSAHRFCFPDCFEFGRFTTIRSSVGANNTRKAEGNINVKLFKDKLLVFSGGKSAEKFSI